ncbi:glycosyltransferase [Phycisphaerales bacterium AB-hyl4]|uniref:Glycosyltransferase n=1 Tax=Natronomicrosphaera hydrolytica TaxID=3242702 RepID=A0ABV4UA06_9BACT
MAPLIPLALYGWPLVAIALFAWLPLRTAILATFLGGWMFLPMETFYFEGIPNYDKSVAIIVGILAGLALHGEIGRLTEVRPHWFDLPMAVWIVLPFFSAVSVGLGVYDGLSGILTNFLVWGMPYWIGRAFFSDPADIRLLATAIVVAGLVYVPFCLYESRFSPQLHNIVYGYHQHDFRQTLRYGGYRPMVFMTHGLMVAMFMATATLMAVALWYSGARQRLLNMPMAGVVVILLITTILSRSTGALLLMALGGAAILAADHWRKAFPLTMLAMVAPVYVFSRLGQTNLAERMVQAAETIFGPQRAASLYYRIYNEEALMQRAFEAPIFGWRGWNLARQIHPGMEPHEMPVAESMWILAFGQNGLVGLAAFITLMILAPIVLFRRLPKPLLRHPTGAVVACMGLGAILYSIDGMFNAMLNPMFMLMLGTVTGLLAAAPVRRIAPPPRKDHAPPIVAPRAAIPQPPGPRPLRILYATGPGDLIPTYRHWRHGNDDPSQMNVAYTHQFHDMCSRLNASAWLISPREPKRTLDDGDVRIDYRPIPLFNRAGPLHHLGLFWYSLRLVASARRYRADLVVSTRYAHWFVLSILPALGIAVVPSLHGKLWATHRTPGIIQRTVLALSKRFFAHHCQAIMVASDDIAQQVRLLTTGPARPIRRFSPLYRRAAFANLAPPDFASRPFRVLYAGRIETTKGVDDLLTLARQWRAAGRDDIRIDLCGDGSHLAALQQQATALNLDDRFKCHGHCNRNEMQHMLAAAHIVVVPTRASLHEGFNQVVVEAVMAGRPVVSSRVCPATAEVPEAVWLVEPDAVDQYRHAIETLADDEATFNRYRAGTRAAADRYFDGRYSWGVVLETIVRETFAQKTTTTFIPPSPTPTPLKPTDVTQ